MIGRIKIILALYTQDVIADKENQDIRSVQTMMPDIPMKVFDYMVIIADVLLAVVCILFILTLFKFSFTNFLELLELLELFFSILILLNIYKYFLFIFSNFN